MRAALLLTALILISTPGARAGAPQAPRAASAATTPDSVVGDLYRVHRKGYGGVFDRKGRRLQQRFFDERLAGLIWKDLTETPQDMVGRLDFDPLYNAQDIRITRFRVGPAAVEGDRATVPVTFNNYQRRERLKFLLTKTAGVWKISDIEYGGGESLLKILTEPI